MSIEIIVLIMFISLIGLLLTGLPLAFVLGGLAMVFAFFLWGPNSMLLVAVQSWGVMTSYFMVAIPLYVFMANILERSGIVEDLFSFMQMWFGPLRGGLAIGTIVICTLMAAMTGIVGAAVASMGILALPAMLHRKYDKRIALGSICAGGTLGILIPPSVITIVYAVTAGVSIGKMFIGGVLPGLLLSGLFITYIIIRCWLQPEMGPAPTLEERSKYNWKDKIVATKTVILPVLLIVGVLGSIYTGIATPTEAAGVGCLGAVISALIYRRLTWNMLGESIFNTALVTCMILWITIGARCYISVFSAIGGDDMIKDFVLGLDVNRWYILIIMQIILVFLGMFLDEIGIILLCVPIFLPIIKSVGFDPVWFGILFLVNAQMNYITPPFGYTLFYLKGVAPAGVNMGDIYRGSFPFVLLQAIGLALCMMFPQIVLYLPNLMK
ncbi:MAG TPA: TRAP transporter large permease subunit [Deltaproteobacteria bacterium]|nr:TRAP transporter large permease subunit [Deltaproteobacteria bacterium]HPJ95115.1 TRAP transporter large permease subunit [Deltaproteobacteria bacterium]